MGYVCPVCRYEKLRDPPYNEEGHGSYEICICCGFQFGVDDDGYPEPNRDAHNEWRKKWVSEGCVWYSKYTSAPDNWNPQKQLEAL